MKSLNRALLIHWLHYDKELVDLKTINFFTGNNGAGKSAFLDALQVVLLGEISAKNFNKAANDRSQRTLDGYLRAERDGKSTKNRKNKDFCSYIVCEFYDEDKKDYFVVGIVFECYKNGDKKYHFFGYDGEIPSHCYTEHQVPMTREQLKKFLLPYKEKSGNVCWTDEASTYRDHFITRTGVHDHKLFSLLKKSIALKEVRRIEDFITENVCDVPEPPDIYTMQENIRNYKEQEKLAQLEQEKLVTLEEISVAFSRLEGTRSLLEQQEFLVLWGQQESHREHLTLFQTKAQSLQEESQNLAQWLEAKTQEKVEKKVLYDQLRYQRDHDDAVKEKKRLESLLLSLSATEKTLSGGLEKELAALKEEAQTLMVLSEQIQQRSPLFPTLHPLAAATEKSYAPFLQAEISLFAQGKDVFTVAESDSGAFAQELSKISHECRQKLEQLAQDIEEKEEHIEKLKKNIKSYPKGVVELRNYLFQRLNTPENPCEVEILADTLEIVQGEEGWRGTIEAYLNTQKFYLMVSPSHYSEGLRLFQQWKQQFHDKDSTFGLVDLKKLREKGHISPHAQSLGMKLQTTHRFTQDYIHFLLGDVICCHSPEETRAHRKAVTQDGLVYQGFVLRNFPKRLMETAFIGKKAVELQLKQMEQERTVLLQEQGAYQQSFAPFQNFVQGHWLLRPHYLSHDLLIQENNYLALLENARAQESTKEALGQCNLFWLDELEERIRQLEEALERLEQSEKEGLVKQGELGQYLKHLQTHEIPDAAYALEEKVREIAMRFTDTFRDEVGLPRFAQELARLGKIEIIVENFRQERKSQTTREEKQRDKLINLRQELSLTYTGMLFSADDTQNDSYEEEKQLLLESKLPAYEEKIKAARESAIEQFQNEFIDKLKSNMEQVQQQIKDLNKALKGTQFGSDSYEFLVEPNPAYRRFYDMITSKLRMEGDVGLFRMSFASQFEAEQEELFMQLASVDDSPQGKNPSELEKNIKLYTDFRTYLNFDMESTDRQGTKQRLSKVLATNSGGETQTPFYVAMLASYAQLYKVHQVGSTGNTMRLVIFDEAFSKMDGDRIIECVKLLRTLNLQGIMCTPPEKVSDIMPEVDQTLLFTHINYKMTTCSYLNEQGEGLGT